MRFLINNLIETAIITTEDQTSISFPLDNIFSAALTDRAQSADSIMFDLGSAKAPTYAAIKNYTPTTSNRIRGKSTPFTSSFDNGDYQATIPQDSNVVELAPPQAYRYWMLVFAAPVFFFRTGYFFLGDFLQVPPTGGAHERDISKTDIKKQTSAGTIYPTGGISTISESVKCPFVLLPERDVMRAWWFSPDSANNHIIIPFEDDIINFIPYYGSVYDMDFKRERSTYMINLEIREAK